MDGWPTSRPCIDNSAEKKPRGKLVATTRTCINVNRYFFTRNASFLGHKVAIIVAKSCSIYSILYRILFTYNFITRKIEQEWFPFKQLPVSSIYSSNNSFKSIHQNNQSELSKFSFAAHSCSCKWTKATSKHSTN